MPGTGTSDVEVSIASNRGFWLLVDDEELFLSFADFPWFRNATVEQLTTVERPGAGHLYWPLLDVDLAVQSIRDPAAYPLISKVTTPQP
jgi:hypothetical protein